jgi:hypothetical protein
VCCQAFFSYQLNKPDCHIAAALCTASFIEQLLFTIAKRVMVYVQQPGGFALIAFGNFKRFLNIGKKKILEKGATKQLKEEKNEVDRIGK